MDFSIPGSDTWETTSTQETFIAEYFRERKVLPTSTKGKVKKRKKDLTQRPLSDNPLKQPKKKKTANSQLLDGALHSSTSISESCYEPKQALSPHDDSDSFHDNSMMNNESRSNPEFSNQSKILKGKNQKLKKKKSSKLIAKQGEGFIPLMPPIVEMKMPTKKQKLKKESKQTHSHLTDSQGSKNENSIVEVIDSDQEQLRDEIKSNIIFKKIQKLIQEDPSLGMLGDPELFNNKSSQVISDNSSIEDHSLSSDSSSEVTAPIQASKASIKKRKDNKISSLKTNFDIYTPSVSNAENKKQYISSEISNSGNDFKQNDHQTLIRNVLNYKEKMRSSSLNKAQEKLRAAKFRYLNEKLYTGTGECAFKYFQKNRDEFLDYHSGYSLQVTKWPFNPVDKIILDLQAMEEGTVIADMGCGDAKIAQTLSNMTVHSFDLVALNDLVTECDISKVPLPKESVDVVVFCLSLMGTNLADYLREAHRILKISGILKIAEVESRIKDINDFTKRLKNCGFVLENQDQNRKMFVFLDLKKEKKKLKNSEIPAITLNPCLYRKR